MTESLFATLNGNRVVKADVTIPWFGIWTADVALDSAVELSGPVTLVLSTLTLKGTVFRGSSYQGAANYRVLGGFGGWQKTVPARAYTHNVGVKLSTVIADAARECGEKANVISDRVLGQFFVRELGPASRVIGQTSPTWWIDLAGTTQIGERTSAAVAAKFDVLNADPKSGTAELASEAPTDILPGNTLDVHFPTRMTIATVTHRVEKGKFRTEVFAK